MRILHVYNRHRGGGGADDATDTTIRLQRAGGLDVEVFERDSGSLSPGTIGRVTAFADGLYARAALADFARVIQRRPPDVVHAHELYPLISPWILRLCARAGIPVVLTCYDYRLTCPIATHYCHGSICHRCVGGKQHWVALRNCRSSVFESVAFGLRSSLAHRLGLFRKHVTTFVVLSDFAARWLHEQAKLPVDRITIIPCAIPMPESAVDDPASGAFVGYAGRLAPEKGVQVLLDAARVAGLPVRIAANAATTDPADAPPGAELLLTRSKQELAEFYRAARVLVVPSIWYETFGLVVAEAMSHGIPVVVSRIGALQEWAADGQAGMLFEPGDVGDLAEKLKRIWDDPALCRRLGAAAALRAHERCSEAAHLRRHVELYNRLTRRDGTPQSLHS